MIVIKVDGASKEWNGKKLFEKVDLLIEAGEHVALIGKNGVGKTSLFKALMNQVQLDKGSVYRHYPIEEWGWLEQNLEVPADQSLIEFVLAGTPNLYEVKKQLASLEIQIANPEDPDLETHLNNYNLVLEHYIDLEGYSWEQSVENWLQRFGFEQEKWHVPYSKLSGGEKTRAQFTRLQIKQPKMLILDEPTNHLDQDALEWLENWVQNYSGTILFSSHDRTFLDRVAHKSYEISASGTKLYNGGYTAYSEQRALEIKTQQSLFEKQERERKSLQQAIVQYHQWSKQAHDAAGKSAFARKQAAKLSGRALSKEKDLQRLQERKVNAPHQEAAVKMAFTEEGLKSKVLVKFDNVKFTYQDRHLFENLSFDIEKEDRIAVIGRNGIGKSTLLKLIIDHLQPTDGLVLRHPALKIGYFSQSLENLHLEGTVLDAMLKLPNMTQSFARTILAGFLFRADDVFKKVGDLSMGERCRVAFVQLYFSESNLLVLDEPANYLDIPTREQMEEALIRYPGTLVLVSHDRLLTRKVANKILHLKGSVTEKFRGTYDEYFDDQDTRRSSENAEQSNLRHQLELKLTQLLSQEEPKDPASKTAFWEEIREIKAQLTRTLGRHT